MASTYLQKTNVSQTLNSKFTISVWVKRGELSSSGMNAICGSNSTGSHATQFFFDGPSLRFYDNFSSTDLVTTRKFRDTTAWYHVLAAIDTSQSTAADRVKIYVNGTQETSFATSNYPGQGDGMIININGYKFYVGTAETTGGSKFGYFDGCMSHFHFMDGQQYDASVFGSTDATTGIWKINTSPSVTYGNNGFFILKDSNSVTDQSGNSNNFTVGGGTLTNTEDCPSNNFCTMNLLQSRVASNGVAYPMSIYSNGNTKIESSNTSAYTPSVGTLGVSSGKYYFECKMGALGYSSFADTPCIGIKSLDTGLYDTAYDDTIRAYSIAGNKNIDGTSSSFGNTFTTNDIIGVAMDLDNGAVYFSKNGTWENSGDPTSGSSKTGALATDMASYKNWSPFAMGYKGSSGSNTTFEFNFGNGYFGTTAISSEGTNASGIGKFEYNVPTGYTALSTKGLNE